MTPMDAPRRIALVDDHRLFAEGFKVMLSQGARSYEVTEFDDPVAFLESFSAGARFDLVIVDLVMRGMNGLALLSALRGLRSTTRVLILSGITSDPPIADMKRLGAAGFVHKSANMDMLMEAIERTLSGRQFFEALPDSADAHDGPDAGWDALDKIPKLAPRQLEVLHLMGQGATNKAIAETLDISENTVKSHMRAIFDAFGVRTRTACVRKGQLLGFL